MLAEQVKVLWLWDEIHLPHIERKWISGAVILILWFEVDPNMMMVYLSPEKCQQLVDCIQGFI